MPASRPPTLPPPPPERRSSPQVWIFVAGTAIVAIDVATAIRGVLSAAMTMLGALLILPSVVTLVRRGGDQGGGRPGGRSWALPLASVALLLVCVVSKWRMLEHAVADGPAAYVALYRTYAALLFVVFAVGMIGLARLEAALAAVADHPARLMILSFGLTALLGGFLLTLPQSVHRVTDATFLGGLFTAVSAVCVTGLSVHPVGQTYTLFGQGVILALMQVGGLGIMVLSTFFAIAAGRRMRVRRAAVIGEMIDADSLASFRRKVKSIVLLTVLIESLGAGALYLVFSGVADIDAPPGSAPAAGGGGAVWAAVFHSVSAFCNAGFSTFDAGLVPFAESVPVSSLIMLLIIVGGLGFPVLDELGRSAWGRIRRRRPPRLSLHARAALWTSGGLVIAGTLAFLVLEWSRTMADLPWSSRLLTASFQSVTARTAGFNTLDFGAMRPATLLVTCALMFIGGSPGSTAGGIKTTTLAVLLANLRAELRSYEAPRLLQRTIPEATVRRATGVALLSVLFVGLTVLTLTLTEDMDFLKLAFEAFSAFGTAGLSTGITADLSVPGRLTIIATMFAGRIGPLTVALALAQKAVSLGYRLPEERVNIG